MIDLSPHNPLILLLAAVFGAVIGSFLTLITYRLPRDEKIGFTRSRCPYCSASIPPRDMVPILSWAMLLGRCRACKARMGWRYPLTEIASALGAAFAVWRYGLSLDALAIAGLWWGIVALTVTDLEHYIILDEVQIIIGLFGLLHVYAAMLPLAGVVEAAATGLAIGLALKYGFLLVMKKDGLGMGDVKFLFIAGIWLASPMDFVPFLFYSGALGVICGLAWRLAGRGERFPFGPALALSLFVCVAWPQAADHFWRIYGLLQ